ncbi:hypothetical protein C0993_000718 [Termitomyces sp. T159_Od127]|nr:hypothetical protein C0993_000718 [Termitomyces sp. T159_Od127]
MAQCRASRAQVGPFPESSTRSQSDRFVHGTKPVLIKRAKIWTGTKNGTEVIHGDILLDKGLIKSVGHLYGLHDIYGSDLVVVDAKDGWVTPGIVDIHSHLGDSPSPALNGAEDGNSLRGTIQPWLRSLDGLNTHDDSYPLSIAGGVTTALVLPGSTNAIGASTCGQAFVIKLRSTKERRFYEDTRMDVSWEFRQAYKKAFDLMVKQDQYCSQALAGKWKGLGDFPQDLQWEALVDVIRGRVKVNAHCYEAVDLDALVRLSNEFKFPIAAVHHASEAYLVPDLLKKTYDLVIWDSHPLALGATPVQVFIDGIPQLQSPHIVRKPKAFQESPKVPNFDKEAAKAVQYEGLPPLAPAKPLPSITVFTNISSVYLRRDDSIEMTFSASSISGSGIAVVQDGSMTCLGQQAQCLSTLDATNATFIDLEGGSIAPGLVSFGSPLGLHHIQEEESTNDGDVFDPFIGEGVPNIAGGDTAVVRAMDGLLFGSRDAYLAFRAGVTSAITAPTHKNFLSGLGVSFSLGATNGLEAGAVIQDVAGLHVTVKHLSKPSVSSQIAALRRLLLGEHDSAVGFWFKKVVEGEIPLVVEAHSADIIATLIVLKKEVEARTGSTLKLTITGATEAHILAEDLGEARVGVILNPSRPFPYVWENRRILPGPPLTRDSAIVKLKEHGVTVGVGCEEIWSARNLPFDVAWAAIEAGGRISRLEALALGTVNVQKLLGVEVDAAKVDLVVTRGGELLDFDSKVVAVLSSKGASQLLA